MMLSNFRKQTNKSKKVCPVLCLKVNNLSVYGMRSVSDPCTNYQVRVISTYEVAEKIKHAVYNCKCQKVGCPDMIDCEGAKMCVCYHCLAAIRKMASGADKKVVFYKSIKNALLKRKITKGSLIEVRTGNKSVWGVVR